MKNLISLAIIGLMLFTASSCGNSRDYYGACEDQNFKKAHRILNDMRQDIQKELKDSEGTNFTYWAGLYKEYITAGIHIYEEEFKYLFDQEDDENNPRIKVLWGEFGSWVYQVNEELDGLKSQYGSNYVYEGEFSEVQQHVLLAGAMKLQNTLQYLAQAYNNKEILQIFEQNAPEEQDKNKTEGEAFLKQNAKRDGVKQTASGLQYKILTVGTGAIPAATDRVKVNYEGRLIDGTVIDSSYKRGQPATFACNQVIKGWTEALTMMPVGSKWELYIPQELGYADREAGQIPPYSTLIFTVELLEIVK